MILALRKNLLPLTGGWLRNLENVETPQLKFFFIFCSLQSLYSLLTKAVKSHLHLDFPWRGLV